MPLKMACPELMNGFVAAAVTAAAVVFIKYRQHIEVKIKVKIYRAHLNILISDTSSHTFAFNE